MRFKAKVGNVNLFSKVCSTLVKISKDCIIHLSPDKIQFILTSDITDGIQVWSGMNSKTLFDEYRVESMNNNEIAFEVNIDSLERALKAGLVAQDTVMKLTKKHDAPYLNITTEVQQPRLLRISQDVPVAVLTVQQLASYSEPELPDPDVHITMPNLRQLRNVIDRMKNIGDHLIITANMGGELMVRVDTNVISIGTSWKDLEHPPIEGRPPPIHDKNKQVQVKVDINKFSRFLYCSQVQPANVVCCIVPNKSVVLHVLLEDVYLTYYLPVHSM